ncbi:MULTISPECIES: CsbA family protein [Sporosarcina]|uniref:CsbA family protein n=1 Tax=Sporosarcina TaxID=1569 RepID=UPI00058B18F4|nr:MULTISPECIES: CsbA family protein [Sporosarcina]WJY26071.1 CsbA family protein [Sporosarcina sp. 0.2-SM1T-5]
MESLATKFVLALLLPGLLVVFFTRVTFHHVVGLLLTIALIAASVYAGYTHNWILYAADALSLTAGFWFASRMVANSHRRTEDGQDE